MEYFINQTIHFDSLNGLLSLIDKDNSTVQLSRPSTRLLTELITCCGKTRTREALLKAVWEDHGLRPSGNNLSNHISFLRKIFSQLGANENIITTVPKKGFRLEAEVTPGRSDEDQTEELITNKRKGIDALISAKKTKRTLTPSTVKLLFITLITLVVFFSVTYNLSIQKKGILLPIDSCKIVDLAEDSAGYTEEKLNLLNLFIQKNHINCKKNNSTVYFRFINYFPRRDYDEGVIFLTQCRQINRKKLTHCESYLSATIKKP